MKLTRVVPAVAAMAMLVACSPTPGTALVVGGESFSEADVARMSDACTEALGQPVPASVVVRVLIIGSVFDAMAEQAGQAVGDDDIAALGPQMMPTTGEQLLGDPDCRPVGLAAIKNQLLTEVDPQASSATLKALDVQLNPRYGRLTPDAESVFQDTGSLSVPADAQQ